MNKKACKNIDLMADGLGNFIFESTNKIISDLESNEKYKEAAEGFNSLPRLKRLFDFYIMNFWVVSTILEFYYEYDDFEKICEKIEIGIDKSLCEYTKGNNIMGVVLKDFIKDGEEKSIIIRRISSEIQALDTSSVIGDDTMLGLHVIYEIVCPNRFIYYNSTLSLDPYVGAMRLVSYFGKHIFGKEASERYEYVAVLGPIFAIIKSMTYATCIDVIKLLENMPSNTQ